jgi:hypothetical protein
VDMVRHKQLKIYDFGAAYKVWDAEKDTMAVTDIMVSMARFIIKI